jgi:hypothetical protein
LKVENGVLLKSRGIIFVEFDYRNNKYEQRFFLDKAAAKRITDIKNV